MTARTQTEIQAAIADARPRSAVSHGVGVAGLAGLFAWIAIARQFGFDGPHSALMAVLWCGLPMVAWSLLVDRVHRNPSTGHRLVGAAQAARGNARHFNHQDHRALDDLGDHRGDLLHRALVLGGQLPVLDEGARHRGVPWLFGLSMPYVLWLDRRLIDPRDGAWDFGAMADRRQAIADREMIHDHFRAWAVKGFFLAFMLSIVPGGFGECRHARRWQT